MPKIINIDKEKVIEMYKEGKSRQEIAKMFRVGYGFIYQITKHLKDIKNFEQRCGYERRWAYAKTKNLCEKENGASDYFGEIWLAKTLWILEDWEKISKSKNSPEEKIIKNNTILDFNISEDKLKQMLRRKPYKRGKDPKTKQIWRMYIKGSVI